MDHLKPQHYNELMSKLQGRRLVGQPGQPSVPLPGLQNTPHCVAV